MFNNKIVEGFPQEVMNKSNKKMDQIKRIYKKILMFLFLQKLFIEKYVQNKQN